MFYEAEGEARLEQYEVPYALTCSETTVHVDVCRITAYCNFNNSRVLAQLRCVPLPHTHVYLQFMTSSARGTRTLTSGALKIIIPKFKSVTAWKKLIKDDNVLQLDTTIK